MAQEDMEARENARRREMTETGEKYGVPLAREAEVKWHPGARKHWDERVRSVKDVTIPGVSKGPKPPLLVAGYPLKVDEKGDGGEDTTVLLTVGVFAGALILGSVVGKWWRGRKKKENVQPVNAQSVEHQQKAIPDTDFPEFLMRRSS